MPSGRGLSQAERMVLIALANGAHVTAVFKGIYRQALINLESRADPLVKPDPPYSSLTQIGRAVAERIEDREL